MGCFFQEQRTFWHGIGVPASELSEEGLFAGSLRQHRSIKEIAGCADAETNCVSQIKAVAATQCTLPVGQDQLSGRCAREPALPCCTTDAMGLDQLLGRWARRECQSALHTSQGTTVTVRKVHTKECASPVAPLALRSSCFLLTKSTLRSSRSGAPSYTSDLPITCMRMHACMSYHVTLHIPVQH